MYMKSILPKGLECSLLALVHGNILQKAGDAKHVINLRRRVAQLQMGDLELIFLGREDLKHLLQSPHPGAGECVELSHVDQEITRAAVIGGPRGFEQL